MQVITVKIVKDMFGNISDATASRKISLVRDALDKQKPKIITLNEFKSYYGFE